MPPRIDVHSHYLPPFYRQACLESGHANPDGMPYLPDWSPEAHIALMEDLHISRSIISISSPGVHLVPGEDASARKLARECNAYAADLKRRMPERFGYFAALPLPDVQGCLDEIARAAEEGCDGFGVLTNAHGHYLGDPIFDPIFEELERRKALLFIHPSTPQCACSTTGTAGERGGATVKAAPLAKQYPNPMMEFFFDTARVVTNLFISGTVRRCPNLRIILPHLGGGFPPMLSRWTGFSQLVPGPWQGVSEAEVLDAFNKQIWFDLAGFVFPSQIRSMLYGVKVPHTRMMYGSDFPFTKPEGVKVLSKQMEDGTKELFEEEEIADVCHRNAERLLGSS
jgi:predicted TIM-barrel fold metal-dependent hydrolase